MIAALYVDERGPYPKLPGVDAWGETRDARKYTGDDPVVAHPPCGPWGKLRHLHKRPAEYNLFEYACEAVHACGGVLEHPAGSKAFEAYGLPKPGDPPNEAGGYTVEVCQVEWGHVARKRTWLYLVGVPRDALEPPPFPEREPTHWVSGSRGKSSRSGNPVPTGIKVCSAEQRRRTPPLFAEYLVRLARASRVSKGAT